MEALTYIKDWEAVESRLLHMVEGEELEEAFESLYLDDCNNYSTLDMWLLL